MTLAFSDAHAAPRAANLSNLSPLHARRLYFAPGTTTLRVRGHLSGSQHRFYLLKTRANQRLQIRVAPASRGQLVPLLFVTPPRGHFDGDKTAAYTTNRTRAGDYRLEIAANLMASNARSGPFSLTIRAH